MASAEMAKRVVDFNNNGKGVCSRSFELCSLRTSSLAQKYFVVV